MLIKFKGYIDSDSMPERKKMKRLGQYVITVSQPIQRGKYSGHYLIS